MDIKDFEKSVNEEINKVAEESKNSEAFINNFKKRVENMTEDVKKENAISRANSYLKNHLGVGLGDIVVGGVLLYFGGRYIKRKFFSGETTEDNSDVDIEFDESTSDTAEN